MVTTACGLWSHQVNRLFGELELHDWAELLTSLLLHLIHVAHFSGCTLLIGCQLRVMVGVLYQRLQLLREVRVLPEMLGGGGGWGMWEGYVIRPPGGSACDWLLTKKCLHIQCLRANKIPERLLMGPPPLWESSLSRFLPSLLCSLPLDPPLEPLLSVEPLEILRAYGRDLCLCTGCRLSLQTFAPTRGKLWEWKAAMCDSV